MSDGVYITIGGNADELKAALEKSGEAATTLGAILGKLAGGMPKLETAALSAGQSVGELGEIASETGGELEEAALGAEKHGKSVRGASEETEKFSLATSGARRELIVLAHEMAMGNYSRFGGSMMVMAERAGGVSLAMMGMAGAIAVTGLVIGEALMRQGEFAQSLSRIDAALDVSHNAATFQAGAWQGYINALMRVPGVTRDSAQEIAVEWSRIGDIGPAQINRMIQAMPGYLKVTGEDAPAAARVFAEALDDPAKGIDTLQKNTHALSDATIANTKEAMANGDVMTARQVMLDGMAASMQQAATHSTDFEDASHRAGLAAQGLGTALFQSSTGSHLAAEGLGLLAGGLEALKVPIAVVGRAFADLWYGDELFAHAAMATIQPLIGLIGEVGVAVTESARAAVASARGDFTEAGNIMTAIPGKVTKAWEASTAQWQHHIDVMKEEIKNISEPLLPQQQPQQQETPKGPDPSNGQAALAASLALAEQHKTVDRQRADIQLQINQMTAEADALQQKLSDAAAGKKSIDEADQAVMQRQIATLRDGIAAAKEQKDNLGKSSSAADPSQMQAWRTQLAEQRAASSANQAQMLQDDLAFWQAKKANLAAGSRDEIAVNKEIAQATIAIHKEEAQAAAAARKEQEAADKASADTDVALGKLRLDGERERLDAEVEAGNMTADQKIAALQRIADAEYQLELQSLEAERAAAADKPLAWQQAQDKILMLSQNYNNQLDKLADQSAAAQKRAADQSAQAWQSALAPISRATDSMLQGVMMGTQSAQQAVARAGANMAISYAGDIAKMTANFLAYEALQNLGWTKMAASVATEQTKEVAKYLSGKSAETTATVTSETTKTAATHAGTAARTAADASGQSTFLGRVATQVASWLGLEVGKTAETTAGTTTRTTELGAESLAAIAAAKATAAGVIPAYAAEGAVAAMASVACIPYIGWAMAPDVGADQFGEGMSYLAAASAAGGWGEVPADGMLTELHKQEMVLPANLANPMRAMLTSAPSYGLPPGLASGGAQMDAAARAVVGGSTVNNSSSAGGDTHHYNPQTTIHMGPGTSKLSADDVGTAVASALRDGHTQLLKQMKRMRP